MIISLIIIFIYLFFLFFPFKILVKLDNFNFSIYLFKKKVLQQNILEASKEIGEVAYQSYIKQALSLDDIRYLKLFTKLNYKVIDFKFCGLQNNYALWSMIYGNMLAVVSIIDYTLDKREIPFTYKIDYQGVPQIQFNCLFTVQLGKIIMSYLLIRRRKKRERTSN